MSVDYSFSIGYGVAGLFNELSELPGKLKELDWDDIYEGNIDLPEGVTFDVGGDQMCGDRRWILCVSKTYKRADKYDMEVLTKLEPLTAVEAQSLYTAMDELGLDNPDYSPSWYFMCNVS